MNNFVTQENKLTMHAKLTDTAVRKYSTPNGKRIDVRDGVIPGLMLRVSGRERKAFTLTFRYNGKQRRKTIGYYPNLLLGEARAIASKAVSQAKMGIDPFPENDNSAGDYTFKDILDLFMKEHGKHLRKSKDIKRNQTNHVLPHWGDLKAANITANDVRRLLRNVEVPTSGNLKGGLHAARDIYKWGSRIFSWSVARGILIMNPFDAVSMPGSGIVKPRERILTMQELMVVWDSAGKLGYPFGPMYQVLILTGQRLREIAQMRWEWIDPCQPAITIPSTHYKSGKPHIVPFSNAAWNIVSDLPKWNGGPYIFSTTNGKRPISGFSRGKERLDKAITETLKEQGQEAQPITDWVVHDLRRTLRSGMARLGIEHTTAEMVIGHTLKGVHGVYDQYDRLKERREAMEQWAKEIGHDFKIEQANNTRLER